MAGFNPFKSKPPVQKPNRNAFDLSHANNLTMEFGKLYPVLCQEVIPGDTFDIDTTFGLRFMPMVFPVQTRMRADLHFFYVRNRNLWSDWKDFYGRTKQNLKMPYLKITQATAAKRLATGSLLDYLGVPTTLVGSTNPSFRSSLTCSKPVKELSELRPVSSELGQEFPTLESIGWQTVRLSTYTGNYRGSYNSGGRPSPKYTWHYNGVGMPLSWFKTLDIPAVSTGIYRASFAMFNQGCPFNLSDDTKIVLDGYASVLSTFKASLHIFGKKTSGLHRRNPEFECLASTSKDAITFSVTNGVMTTSTSASSWKCYRDVPVTSTATAPTTPTLVPFVDTWNEFLKSDYDELYLGISSFAVLGLVNKAINPMTDGYPFVAGASFTDLSVPFVSDASQLSSPFVSVGTNAPAQPLSALPCRAYESIYNSFYRNIQVIPFKINNQIEYNKFIPSDSGGADIYDYDFHYRDWEDDFLTTALPSPQQGVAPLVGAFQNKETQGTLIYFDSEGVQQTMKIDANKSGDVTAISVRDGNLPESTIKSLNEAIQFGISINDFRNVNALQRWLEKNMRRGFRYKDQILSHFGTNISYEACDMPEYIGGISQDVNVSTVTQSSNNDFGNLGDQAGTATCLGSSRHKVNKYFDEHGFVMAILSVSPIPTYSQLLPKHFTKFDNLDYYTPEFNHIGMQPIPFREVCPIQVHASGGSLDDTFGYQRAWYDYLASVDEVHGQFRTTLRNYLVNRVFATNPELGEEFLRIDPQQVNNIFNYTGTSDKIVGQLYFNITAVRPISKFGEPRLE